MGRVKYHPDHAIRAFDRPTVATLNEYKRGALITIVRPSGS